MVEQLPQETTVFRAGAHLYVILGIFVTLFLALGLLVGIKRDDWTIMGVVAGGTAVFCLLLSYLKLELGERGFSYRNLTTNRWVSFAEIERSYFETIRTGVAPQGVASFWVRLRDGASVKINLRTFPLRAAASLFSAFDRHGIAIDVPDSWAAQRMASQIRAEQASSGKA